MKTARTPVGRVLLEAALVAVVGAAFAFAANRVSPRGLVLARDYFPPGTNPPVRMAAITAPADSPTDTNPAAPSAVLRLTTPTEGLEWRLIDGDRTVQLLHDSHLRPGAIVFIDARDEEAYLAGHIPGAYGFDPYHPDKDFPAVLTVCRAAEQIVIYCYGSNCDDSQMAARLLRNVGISGQKIFVYGGGITEWTNNHQPVEIGARNSGNVNITIQ
ncbi:MAG TPA: rhodanese-like domain-containing protein [Verrucomicrobiae bacterium]|nr:rhodanese-like domain-containing protein [Verrucomicrobiae bacterium]